MKIDNILLDQLTAQAKVSPRLRMNFDLRNSDADMSQRMLNAIEPGSEVPVHRHQCVYCGCWLHGDVWVSVLL